MWILLVTNFAMTFQLSGGALAFASTLWPTLGASVDWLRLSDMFFFCWNFNFEKIAFFVSFWPKKDTSLQLNIGLYKYPVANPWCQRGLALIIKICNEISIPVWRF